MITAAEILDAVKKGGIEHWAPRRHEAELHQHQPQPRTVSNMELVLSCMSYKNWKVEDLRDTVNERSGRNFKNETIRKYLNELVWQGKVERSCTKQPYLFKKL